MHPKDEDLIATLFGDIPEDGEVSRHVAGCARCRENLRRFDTLLATLREDRDPEPPREWVESAIALRRRQLAEPLWERLAAFAHGLAEQTVALIADSSTALAPAGVRSAASGRRLRFENDVVELDLSLEKRGAADFLTGQLLRLGPPATPAGAVALLILDARGRLYDATTDDLGEFALEIADASKLVVRAVVDDHLFVFDVAPEPAGEP